MRNYGNVIGFGTQFPAFFPVLTDGATDELLLTLGTSI